MSAMTAIGEDIWMIDGEIVSFHGFAYPTRSVVIRLADQSLWIWSPVALDRQLRHQLQSIGRPTNLVSPNKLHHLYLGDWRSAFPDARLWGPASSLRKRPDLPFQAPLTDQPPSAWLGQIDQCWVRGSFAMDEIVFFHRNSRTAILADLSENFASAWLSEYWSKWQRPLAYLSGIVEGRGYAPLDWRLTFVRRDRLRQARKRILDWHAQRVVMAHGRWQPNNGSEFLAQAFEWME
jgi:hypothetical protein